MAQRLGLWRILSATSVFQFRSVVRPMVPADARRRKRSPPQFRRLAGIERNRKSPRCPARPSLLPRIRPMARRRPTHHRKRTARMEGILISNDAGSKVPRRPGCSYPPKFVLEYDAMTLDTRTMTAEQLWQM